MSIHGISHDTPVNEPRLRRAIKMIHQIAKLSAHKAALHHTDPRRFPLEQARCFERIFLQHIQELPVGKQQQKVAAAAAVADAPAEQRALSLGALAGVNLQSPIPISEQVFGSARVKAAVPDLSRIADDGGEFPRRGPGGIDRLPLKGGGTGRLPVKRLVLRVHGVKCVKETGEWGKDEIDMAATAVTVTNTTGAPQVSKEMSVDPFRVGSFHSGNERMLGDKILYPFYPPAPDGFPAVWLVALLLIERDAFGRTSTIRKRLRNIQEQLLTEVRKAAQLSNITDDGVDSTLRDFIGITLLILIFVVASMFVDEFFEPAMVGLAVDSPNSELLQEGHVTQRQTVTVVRRQGEDRSEDGKYEITYSWAVIK